MDGPSEDRPKMKTKVTNFENIEMDADLRRMAEKYQKTKQGTTDGAECCVQ